MSARTVERHLSNVYRKLGVSGPAEPAGAPVLLRGSHECLLQRWRCVRRHRWDEAVLGRLPRHAGQ